MVVTIDELDRCRPSYAIELLEIAKHIFMTPNVIFVLAVNTSELEKSIKSLYGPDFDSERYLRRFINLPIKIPIGNLSNFTEAKFNVVGLARGSDASLRLHETPFTMLQLFFNESGTNPRDVEQAIYQINLTCSLAPSLNFAWQTCMAIVLILRLSNPALFNNLTQGIVSEQAIMESVLAKLPLDGVASNRMKPVIESTIIAGGSGRSEAGRMALIFNDVVEMSPLASTSSGYAEHLKIINEIDALDFSKLDRVESQTMRERARDSNVVLQRSNQILRDLWTGDERPALEEAAYLMDLLAKWDARQNG